MSDNHGENASAFSSEILPLTERIARAAAIAADNDGYRSPVASADITQGTAGMLSVIAYHLEQDDNRAAEPPV